MESPAPSSYRCCGCGTVSHDGIQPCGCATGLGFRTDGVEPKVIAFISRRRADCLALSGAIKAHIIGESPDDRTPTLSRQQWDLIVSALEEVER